MVKQKTIKRIGRTPIDPNQPVGERAVTVSFSLGKDRRELLHSIRIAMRSDSLSTVIRKLIDDKARELGLLE